MTGFNSQVYGSKLNTVMSAGSGGLPLKQKMLVASLMLMIKRGTCKEVGSRYLPRTTCEQLYFLNSFVFFSLSAIPIVFVCSI